MVNIEIHGLTKFGFQNIRSAIYKRFSRKRFAVDLFVSYFNNAVISLKNESTPHFRVYGDVNESDHDSIVAILLDIGSELEMGVQYLATKYSHPKKRKK